MPSFFELYFDNVDFDGREETPVCCPFPHHVGNDMEYYETHPSASVNVSKGVFNCLSCGKGASETGFIAQTLGCNYETASRIRAAIEKAEHIETWKELAPLPDEIKSKLHSYGITDDVIEELNIRSDDNKSISFPVTLYGALLDVRNYRPGERPKMKSRHNAIAGLILPYDLWRISNKEKWTLLCAGEKDMAVARSHRFNAITLTGGEMTSPLLKNEFKERKIAIVYDNDNAGKEGAQKIAAILKPYAKEIKIVTAFHEICKENGEDITDFFTKYAGTREQMVKYIKDTPLYTDAELEQEQERQYPTVTLMEATQPRNANKTLRSNIQVVATEADNYDIANAAIIEKHTDDPGHAKGTKKEWYLSETNLKCILYMIGNKFKDEEIKKHIKSFVSMDGEKGVSVKIPSVERVWRCNVTDLMEGHTKNMVPVEYTAYVIGDYLKSGMKYKATYRLVPHPFDGHRMVMVIMNVSNSSDTVTNFKINPETIAALDLIKDIDLPVQEKVEALATTVRALTKFPTNLKLIQAIDLSYNTVLEFNFQNFKEERGYLDTLIITESRVGKSSTSTALHKMYELGVFASLAGSSATVAGIIGGSNKVNGTFQTRAGIIPQNHRGLVILEELAKCNSSMIKELTDVRSSGVVRITRVNSHTELPALVRTIALTNPKTAFGTTPREITSYPNGIEIVVDLIQTAEDIARYDLILVLPEEPILFDDKWVLPMRLPDIAYKTRIRWIWSRNADQIIIPHDVESYILNKCNDLNSKYNSHIKIFGTEAWKKVSRLAIAAAGYCVSTDETYENIIVTKEHVDYAVNYYVSIYDNEIFRLGEYVEGERKYTRVDDEAIAVLQDMFLGMSTLLLQLESNSSCTRPELMAALGLNNDQFSMQLNNLVKGYFIRFQGQQIIPTLRFRRAMRKINRAVIVMKIGEHNA